jgi:hypothetical protein
MSRTTPVRFGVIKCEDISCIIGWNRFGSRRVYITIQNNILYRPIALTSQILRVSSRCSLKIYVLVQQPHTAQKLTILIQNYYKVLQNLLCLQKLYYASIASLSSRCIVTGAVTSCAMGLLEPPRLGFSGLITILK